MGDLLTAPVTGRGIGVAALAQLEQSDQGRVGKLRLHPPCVRAARAGRIR
jgi:hypothetical protein